MIEKLALDWPIDTGSADWHRIGSGLARIGSDWLGLANWRICVVTKNWRPIGIELAWIGTGLAQIGSDWLGLANWKILAKGKIGPRLAQDWCRLASNWLRIGIGFAWIG